MSLQAHYTSHLHMIWCPTWRSYLACLNSLTLNLDVPLVATHIPHTLLPKSIINSDCKIIYTHMYRYICRDPNDVFMSSWHFVCNMSPKAVDAFASEDRSFISRMNLSSFLMEYILMDHIGIMYLGYWRANLEVKKIVQIIGYPFSLEDENKDVVHNIINLYSFENLSGLNVNKSEITHFRGPLFKNNTFFRKSKIGDWKNHLTPKMTMLLNKIIEHKLNGSGLVLHVSSNA